MSTTATTRTGKLATFQTLDDNLAAAMISAGFPFHPDYRNGRGNIAIVSNGKVKEGWHFSQQSAFGASLKAVEQGWEDPGGADKFVELLNKVEGQLGEDLRDEYERAAATWQRNFIQTRGRLLDLKSRRKDWENLIQVDRGKRRWLFNKDNAAFIKAHDAAK